MSGLLTDEEIAELMPSEMVQHATSGGGTPLLAKPRHLGPTSRASRSRRCDVRLLQPFEERPGVTDLFAGLCIAALRAGMIAQLH